MDRHGPATSERGGRGLERRLPPRGPEPSETRDLGALGPDRDRPAAPQRPAEDGQVEIHPVDEEGDLPFAVRRDQQQRHHQCLEGVEVVEREQHRIAVGQVLRALDAQPPSGQPKHRAQLESLGPGAVGPVPGRDVIIHLRRADGSRLRTRVMAGLPPGFRPGETALWLPAPPDSIARPSTPPSRTRQPTAARDGPGACAGAWSLPELRVRGCRGAVRPPGHGGRPPRRAFRSCPAYGPTS